MKIVEELFYDYVSDTKQAEDFEETKEVEKTLYSYFKDFEHAEGFLDFENCLCKYSCVNEKQGFIKGFLYAGRLLGAALALNDEDAIMVLRELFKQNQDRKAGTKNADA